MQTINWQEIEEAKNAAIGVLLHNANGPFGSLPRTAGWGYPEPYTRDLMFSIFGIAASGNVQLMESIRKVLQTLAENQTAHGHITSLVHDKHDRGASDTTPLFLLGVAIFRKATGEAGFLNEAVNKALTWMEYQSPSDRYLVAQQPTSDWRDEQWVLGYGLFVNTVVYSYLRLLGEQDRADKMFTAINRRIIHGGFIHQHEKEGLGLTEKPWYAFWSYKVLSSSKFDLLGNSIAILSGLASTARAEAIIDWVEHECEQMRQRGDLALHIPPNFFPFTLPGDEDWHPRYENFNMPGNYHNGGIWPFICGLYVAALVAAKRYELAGQKLVELTRLISQKQDESLAFGFNEWIKAQDGKVHGVDWQTWSAALYIFAAECVRQRSTLFFDEIRQV